MGNNQAQKGRARRQARQDFHPAIKEITIAAKFRRRPRRQSSPAHRHPRRQSREHARDNIKRAIQRGTGELPGPNYEEISFEGYGPGGVAIIVDATTDNRNRAVSEIRHAFAKNGGNLGEPTPSASCFPRRASSPFPKPLPTKRS